MKPVVYVVLPVFNRKITTLTFLQRMRQQSYPNIQVVICDDASSDGTAAAIATDFPEVVLLHGDGQLWWTGGINRCVAYVLEHGHSNDLVLTINDDVDIAHDYIAQKVARSVQYPQSIIGSVCVDQQHPDCIETSGLVMDAKRCRLSPLFPHSASLQAMKKQHPTMIKATHLPGKGVLIPLAFFHQLGLYDAQHLPQYHADTEYIYRAHLAGIAIYVDMDSIVLSEVNTSNGGRYAKHMSLRQLIQSVRSPYGLNAWRSYHYLASRYHRDYKYKFLLLTYGRIFGGIIKRALGLR
jgi:GT2 family glycosyltransferase